LEVFTQLKSLKINQMKTHLKLQKFIATLMIFILMIEFTCCYSSRIVTSSDIKSSESCSILGKKIKYHISDAIISDGILSGKISSVLKSKGKINKNYIYVSSDSVVKIENNILSVPVSSITKIEQKIPDPKKTKQLKTALIVGCSSLTVLGVISSILMINTAQSATSTCEGGFDIFNQNCSEW
jgi:hypothetical protein